ncbi:MAG: hypothetical protein GY708_20680 [Actinomycetia bacterium]|nr:hypothetical protein [Actinomycetes bacterium]
MKVRELDVWYYGLEDGEAYDQISWDDVPSAMREQLCVGDRLVITNQDGDVWLADISDLEPCRVNGVYLEDV